MDEQPEPKGIQFSLRALLVVVSLCCLAFGTLGYLVFPLLAGVLMVAPLYGVAAICLWGGVVQRQWAAAAFGLVLLMMGLLATVSIIRWAGS